MTRRGRRVLITGAVVLAVLVAAFTALVILTQGSAVSALAIAGSLLHRVPSTGELRRPRASLPRAGTPA
jgi:hypothetical protein